LPFSLSDLLPLLAVASFLVSIWQSVAQARQKAAQEREQELQRQAEAAEAREADPNTQSYEGYLRRTRQDYAEGPVKSQSTSSVPTSSRTLAADMAQARTTQSQEVSEQDRLRRELARKMAQAGSQPAPQLGRAPAAPPPLPGQAAPPRPRAQQAPPESTQQRRERAKREGGGREGGGRERAQRGQSPQPQAQPQWATQAAPMTVTSLRQQSAVADEQAAVPSGSGRLLPPLREHGAGRAMVQAMVWSEVLGPPKSKRR
jgi:hypothetical protein